MDNARYTRRRVCGSLTGLIITGTRLLVGGVMVFLPFAHDHLNNLQTLGIYAGLSSFLIAEEILARVEERRFEGSLTEGDGGDPEALPSI